MNQLVWLASYPKSGNTWYRIFLTNLIENRDTPADINDLLKTSIASNRQEFDELVGLDSCDLLPDEIESLRAEVYQHWTENVNGTEFHKIHDAYTFLPNGKPFICNSAKVKVIYIIRNPLDVAVSFANHSGKEIDFMIKKMRDAEYSLAQCDKRLNNQFEQKLLSWSEHVVSWVELSGMNLHIMKYEDIKKNTFKIFKDSIKFLELDYTDEQISKAIEFSRFDVLKQQEENNGFNERHNKCKTFFRRGESGSWHEELTEAQIARICSDHRDVMRRFGYI